MIVLCVCENVFLRENDGNEIDWVLERVLNENEREEVCVLNENKKIKNKKLVVWEV